jgi:hypothetical protein
LDGEENRSFLAEDLQQKSLSESVSDDGSQHQKAAYDKEQRLPESSQKKAKKDENKSKDNAEDSLTSCHILRDSH